jgi:cold-inducible RNA-binding protein
MAKRLRNASTTLSSLQQPNAEADRAITELDGRDLDGGALNVNEARPKTERSFGGGGGRQQRDRW